MFDSMRDVYRNKTPMGKNSKADDIIRWAKNDYEDAQKELKKAENDSQDICNDIFDLKTDIADRDISRAVKLIEISTNKKVNSKKEPFIKDVIGGFVSNTLPSLKVISTTAQEALSEGLKGTSRGTALALGSYGVAGTLGAASTGTAISSLSGVAATNATMAWFGGGSLATGGVGIAGGAAVLGGIVFAPLAIGAIYHANKKADERLTEARIYSDKVDVEIKKVDSLISLSKSLNLHLDAFNLALSDLRDRFIQQLENLENENDELLEKQYQITVILFTKAIKKMLSINLIHDGRESEELLKVVEHTRSIETRDGLNSFVNDVAANEKITPPNNIKYLSDIESGDYSFHYFWLQDIYPESKSCNNRTPSKKSSNLAISFTFFIFMSIGLFGVLSSIASILDKGGNELSRGVLDFFYGHDVSLIFVSIVYMLFVLVIRSDHKPGDGVETPGAMFILLLFMTFAFWLVSFFIELFFG